LSSKIEKLHPTPWRLDHRAYGPETEWEYSGRTGSDGKKKICEVSKKRGKVKDTTRKRVGK